MEKSLWEKVLKILPDSELINLVKQTKIPIPPGFRVDSLHRKINTIRSRLIQNALKDVSFFNSILYFELLISENENYEKIRGKKREEILSEIKEVENPYLFIISLLTSTNEEDQKNGQFLLDEYENRKKTLLMEEKKEMTNPKKTDELKKELDKKKKKIQQLEQNLANIKNSFNQECSKWAKEKKKLQIENNEIKKETREKETIIEHMQKELTEMQETIETLSSFKKEASIKPIIQKEVESEDVNIEEIDLPKVALIGKEVPLPYLNQYDVTIVQANEIDQFIHHHDYREIWILTFELTRLQLFKLRTNLQDQQVIEFHTIKELEKHIHHERGESIWQANGTLFSSEC